MAVVTMILGESGTGKSASMRNLTPGSYLLINVNRKPLPFKSKNVLTVNSDSYMDITKMIKSSKWVQPDHPRIIVIDDSQYLLANEYMRSADIKGFDKFVAMQTNFWQLIQDCIAMPDDITVYFLHHVQRSDDGYEKAKSIGKMLDEKITIEGLFSIVLKTCVRDGAFTFRTVNSGYDTVKSPIGLFDGEMIDNDLNFVDRKIREYYEMPEAVENAKH